MDHENAVPIGPRPFLEAIRELRNGRTLDDLADQLNTLVAVVRDTNKAGSLTLKLSIRPATRNDATTVLLEDEVILKLPKPDRAATLMFTTDDNNLCRDNPRQQKLNLRGVPDEQPADLKKVPA